MPIRKGGLGKGLGALLSDIEEDNEEINENGTQLQVSLDDLVPNDMQPRKAFDDSALEALAESIKNHGIISPLVVSPRNDGKYLIIAGERRYRASRLAGLKTVPVFIRDCNKKEIDELALIENIQREDLNPIEIAEAIKNLIDEYGYTQEEAADRVGKSRPAVANYLRLLNLGDSVKALVSNGTISAGHARCMVAIEDKALQLEVAKKIVDGNLSVRETEVLIKKLLNPPPAKPQPKPMSVELTDLVNRMQRVFATKVTVMGNDRKGRVCIDYFSMDDLSRIEELLTYLENKNK